MLQKQSEYNKTPIRNRNFGHHRPNHVDSHPMDQTVSPEPEAGGRSGSVGKGSHLRHLRVGMDNIQSLFGGKAAVDNGSGGGHKPLRCSVLKC